MAAARTEVATRVTPYGSLLTTRPFTTTNGAVDYPIQNPLAMLCLALSESDRYSAYARDALRVHGAPSPLAPWSILLYVDEVTCGNPLAVRADARRKVQGVYRAVFQLGSTAIADETCWFELAAFRTSEAKYFVGSVSHLLDVCLPCLLTRLDTTFVCALNSI